MLRLKVGSTDIQRAVSGHRGHQTGTRGGRLGGHLGARHPVALPKKILWSSGRITGIDMTILDYINGPDHVGSTGVT